LAAASSGVAPWLRRAPEPLFAVAPLPSRYGLTPEEAMFDSAAASAINRLAAGRIG